MQDIALLRAEGERILSTNRGYVAEGQGRVSRVFKVCHTDEQIRDELYLIADAGGCVEDVFVWHKAYGRIAAPMGVRSRAQAEEFLRELAAGVSRPLKNVTGRLPLPHRFGGQRRDARRDRAGAARTRLSDGSGLSGADRARSAQPFTDGRRRKKGAQNS